MNAELRIVNLVDRGLQLRAEIATREAELEAVEAAMLCLARDGEKVDLADEEREGKQFLAQGTKQVVPIIFTADKIIGSFKPETETHRKISAANILWRAFYRQTFTYELIDKTGKHFRRHAEEALGVAAAAFVTACVARDKHGIPKSDIKIEWERAKEIPAQ